LNPIKSKHLYKDVASKLSEDEDVVKSVVEEYYADLRTALSHMHYHRIQVEKIGDFEVKHWLLDKQIERLQVFIDRPIQKMTDFKKILLDNAVMKVQKLLCIKELYRMEEQRKIFFRTHRKKSIHAKSNLEK